MKLQHLARLVAGGLLVAAGGTARAHGIESSLERLAPLTDGRAFSSRRADGPSLQLESRFSSGVPASDALVKLVPPDGGTAIEVGRTDAQGRLSFSLPAAARADWELQVDAGPGHRDYLELPTPQGGHQAHSARRLTGLLASTAPVFALGLLGCVGLAPWLRRRP